MAVVIFSLSNVVSVSVAVAVAVAMVTTVHVVVVHPMCYSHSPLYLLPLCVPGEGKKPEDALAAATTEHEVPIVRPGDASIAAPFTSRVPSVRSVVQLIRQGRCTLLSALQQQQIMMLESVISAVTLSSLSLEGSRTSERQVACGCGCGCLLLSVGCAVSRVSRRCGVVGAVGGVW